GAHAGHQLARAERLRHVVVAAELEPEDTVDLLVLRGEKDDRHLRAAPQPPADLGAVELRHHDVEDDQVGRLAGEALERLLAVGGLDGAEAGLLEREDDDLADMGVVVDDQDRRHAVAMLDEIRRRAKRRGRIGERQTRHAAVKAELASTWGGQQTVLGPLLVVPYQEHSKTKDGEPETRTGRAYFLPERLRIEGMVAPEVRARGIFELILYRATLR